MSKTLKERNNKIIELRKSGLSIYKIGKMFELSPQRILKITEHLGYKRKLKVRKCNLCGKEYVLDKKARKRGATTTFCSLACSKKRLNKWSNNSDKCIDCGRSDVKHKANGLCSNCYYKHNKKRINDNYKRYYKKNRETIIRKMRESHRLKRKIDSNI